MNVIDKIVAYVSPVSGVKRLAARKTLKILNSGYSEGGASVSKKTMKGWNAYSASPDEDIDLNLYMLRNRTRDLYMNSPLGRGAIQTTRTNVVGAGLKLKARIDAEFLGLTDEEADAWEQNAEREFALWAESVYCDSLKINNFYEMQQLAFLSWLMNGDAFAILKEDDAAPFMPYGLRIHLLEADRCSSPNSYNNLVGGNILGIQAINPNNNNRIISGVEIDSNGAVVAYWFSNRYPQSFYLQKNLEPLSWTRVEAFGDLTGRPNVLHLMESERPEQRRGVPFLAPVIEPLKQITRYTEAELNAAVISSFFTIFIKTEGSSSEMPLGDMYTEDEKVPNESQNEYEMGSGAINVLQPGESIESANPSRPNSNFDSFVNALCRYMGAALEIPQELLQKSFQSSYSAARAALLEAWKMFKMRREWLSKDFNQPIYEEWLAEAIARRRIEAPGFFNDPVIRKAWCGSEWNGPAPGQIDPVKEVDAAVMKINNGLSTREKETMELNGSDFDRNIEQLTRENKLMQAAGIKQVQGDQPIQSQIMEGGENKNAGE